MRDPGLVVYIVSFCFILFCSIAQFCFYSKPVFETSVGTFGSRIVLTLC